MKSNRISLKVSLKKVGSIFIRLLEALPTPQTKTNQKCQHCLEDLNGNLGFCKACERTQVSLTEIYSTANTFKYFTLLIQLTASLIILLVGCYIGGTPDSFYAGFVIFSIYLPILFFFWILLTISSEWNASNRNLEDALMYLKLSKIKLMRVALFWPIFLIVIGFLLSNMQDNRPLKADMETYILEHNITEGQDFEFYDHTIATFFTIPSRPSTVYVGVWNRIVPISKYKLRELGGRTPPFLK